MKASHEYPFPEGTLVTVANRTWPGINKPGGAGKVLKAYNDENGVHRVDVKYILSGTEKFIEVEYVTKQVFLDTRRQRRRTQEPALESPNVSKKPMKKATKSALKKKRPNATPLQPRKQKKKVRTNPKPILYSIGNDDYDSDEDDIEPSIPREITIVSCATSTGSLSFNENLLNTNPTYNKQKKIVKTTVRNHKKLTQAATNNRKMTDFFHRSPSRTNLNKNPSVSETSYLVDAEGNDKNSSNFSIHKDVVLKPSSIIRKRSEKKTTNTLKENNQNVSRPKSISPVSKTKLFPKNAKKDPLKIPSVLDKEDNPEQKPQKELPERMDLFITAFMDIIQFSEEIQFKDLINEVNKRMIKNDKFNEAEVNDCVYELEKRNRIMFDKEEGTIFWI